MSKKQNQSSDSSSRDAQLRRGGYEDDYSPHYSGGDGRNKKKKKAKKTAGNANDPAVTGYGGDGTDGSDGGPHRSARKKHTFGKVAAIIQGILSVAALGFLFLLDVLPLKYLIVVAVVLLVLWIFAFFSQFTRKTHIPGKVESIIVSVLLVVACYYLAITGSFLGEITASSTVKIDNIVIVVLQDDPAETLEDAADYVFGISATLDRTNVDDTIDQVNENLETQITVTEYESLTEMVEALYSGEVGALIYNEAYNDTILEDYETFEDDIRVLENVAIETVVEVSTSDKSVTEEAFTMYITGIDTYGSISTTGRSDVNILVTVNPTTKQILLTTTPRDYYVEFPDVTNGSLDKLTHAGIYGVDCSIATLEALYDTEIDYYAKVNFTSVVKLVDLLGGIEVYSEYSFSSIDGIHSFSKGYNTLDGDATLAFVRERKNLSDGDNQRGKNQQAVITALIKKIISPSILTNYSSILSSLSGNFETNMSTDDITELIKMQLSDGAEWNIVSQAVTGTDSTGVCYSSPGQTLYVMIPDEDSVAEAAAKIQAVLDGEILEDGTSTAE